VIFCIQILKYAVGMSELEWKLAYPLYDDKDIIKKIEEICGKDLLTKFSEVINENNE
jgi:hypothetical protein